MNAIIAEIRVSGKCKRYGKDAATIISDVRRRTFNRGKIDQKVMELSDKLRNKGNWKFGELLAYRRIF